MRAKFTVFLRIAAGQASFQTLFAVAIFVFFAIKYALSFWMIAAVTFIYHGGSSLLEKSLVVKDRAHCVRRMGDRAKDPNTLGFMFDAKTEPFCKTILANLFIISPNHVNWENYYPGYSMNCCRETAKMVVPPGNRRVVVPTAYLNGTPQGPAPEDARKDSHIIRARYAPLSPASGFPISRSQQVIHEISGIHHYLGEVDET
jgi:hypothetical protein